MCTPTYDGLLDLLTQHPEFCSDEVHDCDTEIIEYGKALWDKWQREEAQEMAQVKQEAMDMKPEWERSQLQPKTRSILKMIADGHSNVEIRDVHGLTAAELAYIKYRYGLTKKRGTQSSTKRHKFNPEQAKKDLAELHSVAAVARKYNMKPDTLIRYLKNADIDYLSVKVGVTFEQVVTAIKSYGTQTMVADHLRISPHIIKKILADNGTDWKTVKYAA